MDCNIIEYNLFIIKVVLAIRNYAYHVLLSILANTGTHVHISYIYQRACTVYIPYDDHA